MKKKIILIVVAVFAICIGSVNAQTQQLKVGYANLDLILAYMPEMKTANSTLQVYQQKLEEDLQKRQGYLEAKYQDYVALAQEGASQDVLKPLEAELTKLDAEVKQKVADSETKLIEKRTTLMAPLSDRIQTEIKALAAEEGFDLILNSVDGTGNSIVLFSKDGTEVSEKLMKRMGITVPKPEAGQ